MLRSLALLTARSGVGIGLCYVPPPAQRRRGLLFSRPSNHLLTTIQRPACGKNLATRRARPTSTARYNLVHRSILLGRKICLSAGKPVRSTSQLCYHSPTQISMATCVLQPRAQRNTLCRGTSQRRHVSAAAAKFSKIEGDRRVVRGKVFVCQDVRTITIPHADRPQHMIMIQIRCMRAEH